MAILKCITLLITLLKTYGNISVYICIYNFSAFFFFGTILALQIFC